MRFLGLEPKSLECQKFDDMYCSKEKRVKESTGLSANCSNKLRNLWIGTMSAANPLGVKADASNIPL